MERFLFSIKKTPPLPKHTITKKRGVVTREELMDFNKDYIKNLAYLEDLLLFNNQDLLCSVRFINSGEESSYNSFVSNTVGFSNSLKSYKVGVDFEESKSIRDLVLDFFRQKKEVFVDQDVHVWRGKDFFDKSRVFFLKEFNPVGYGKVVKPVFREVYDLAQSFDELSLK